MPLLTLCQLLAVLVIFTALFAFKTGRCEHPCEACARKREDDRKEQKRLQHEYWHVERNGHSKSCEYCENRDADRP